MSGSSPAPAQIHVSHASGLHSVERQLARMHQEMLRQGSEDARGLSLPVLNLVAACTDSESEKIAAETVRLIAADHPARALIILANRGGSAEIEADVSLECAIGQSGQVCAEIARLQISGEPALHLLSLVTPLVVPDIPVFLWLVGAPPLTQAFAEETIKVCERVLIDTGAYEDAVAVLDDLSAHVEQAGRRARLADLAWARIHRWRELIAQAFEGPQTRGLLEHVESVDIVGAGRRVSAQSWLLGGWLAARLDFPQTGGPKVTTRAEPTDGLADGDLASVRIQCNDSTTGATVTVAREGRNLRVSIEVKGGSTAANTVPFTEIDTSRLVGILIEDDRDDPVYADALRLAARLAARS